MCNLPLVNVCQGLQQLHDEPLHVLHRYKHALNEGFWSSVPRMMGDLNFCKSFLFCVHTLGVRSSFDILDPENQPGSGALRPTEDVSDSESMKTNIKLFKMFIQKNFLNLHSFEVEPWIQTPG